MSEYIMEYLPDTTRIEHEEIVRFRDCKEYHPELYSHITCELLGRYVDPNGFCAWGERREP